MKKVVMTVANHFITDHRVRKEAKALVDAGYDVTLFCVKGPDVPLSENRDGIKVLRVLDDYLRLPVSASSRRVRKKWWGALLDANADIYHAHDRDTIDLTAKAAQKLGVPFIYDSHEFWPDKNAYDPNTGSLKDRLSTRWWTRREKYYALQADGLIMTSPGHAKGLVKAFGVQEPVLVRNVPEYHRGNDRLYLREKFGLVKDDRILVFVGNVQRRRGIEQIIESLAFLDHSVHFVMIGYGDYQEILKTRLPEHAKGRVHFHETISSHSRLLEVMYSADIGLAPFQANCYSHRHVLPNKIFDYMMAELPVVVSNFPELRSIVDEVKFGEVVNPADPKDIARAVKKLLDDPNYIEQCRKNAARFSHDKFRWDIEKDQLLGLYKSLLP